MNQYITFKPYKIVNENQPSLREKSEEVKVPVSKEDVTLAVSLFQHVYFSQNKRYAELNNVRPGVGLACPQIGINKRMFAIHANDGEETLALAIVNPKIISTNKELIYLNGGEGCLSVDRKTTDVTPRYSKITVEGFVYDFDKNIMAKKKFILKDYFAIVFQHEFDHLNGVLYLDNAISEDEAKSKNIFSLYEENQGE